MRQRKPSSRSAVSEATLLAAVAANPLDDAPRLVFADWLLERGDVRGEFILLDIAKRAPKRRAEILREHKPRLLGGLAPFVKKSGLRFARGFLVKCELKSEKDLPAVAEVALLEDVAFGWNDLAKTAKPVSLERACGVVPTEVVLRLLTRSPRLSHVETYSNYFRYQPWDEVKAALSTAKRSVATARVLAKAEGLDAHLLELFALPIFAQTKQLTLEILNPPRIQLKTLSAAPKSLEALRIEQAGVPTGAREWRRSAKGPFVQTQ